MKPRITINLLVLSCCLFGAISLARAQAPQSYSSPEEALKDLVAVATAKDRTGIRRIFGADVKRLQSGDEVQESTELNAFAVRASEKAELVKDSDAQAIVVVGNEEWPFPVPLIRKGNQWTFDTATAVDETLRRRIGHNELAAILVCASYAVAQWDYFLDGDWDNNGIQEFAQKLVSSPGLKDGLYWPTDASGAESPLGPLGDLARAEGYRAKDAAGNIRDVPFHGYHLKLLKAQGAKATGGQFSYVINGHMIAGFAMVAYPAVYGQSGVMTFIVNQQGRVYQNNLGPNTAQIAKAMTAYNPGEGWTLVDYSEALDELAADK